MRRRCRRPESGRYRVDLRGTVRGMLSFLAFWHWKVLTNAHRMWDWQAKMDPSIRDWLVIGCSTASLCASLSAPLVGNFLGGLRASTENSRGLRKETYAAILDHIARA